MEQYLVTIATITTSGLLVVMLYASIFVGPLAFRILPGEEGDKFVRAFMERHSIVAAVLALAAAAALAALTSRPMETFIISLVAIGFVGQRFWLIPRTHRLAADRKVGMIGAAEDMMSLQRRGAFMHLAQLISVAIVSVRLAAGV